LYCWLVALHNSLTQSLNDWRETENIDKLTLQIENYNQKISARKRINRIQKERDRKQETENIDPTIQSIPDIILMFPTESASQSNYRRSDRRYNRNTSHGLNNDHIPLSVRAKTRTRTNLLQISPIKKINKLPRKISESLVISESSDSFPRSDMKLNPLSDLTESPNIPKVYSPRPLISHKVKERTTPRTYSVCNENTHNY